MLDLVNRLHSTGVQIDIDLPRIAVIGSQSAGKSSLIESISGVTLPRAAGTCTRCPTECRLSYSADPWKCIVSLHFTTDEHGQPLGQARTESFGAPIFRKVEVEHRIRRAQLAILNPKRDHRKFIDGNEEEEPDKTELTFSTNCVSLQISGKDVADLSFVDLPGLIASVAKGGSSNDIELVKSLVSSYISKSSCLILLTVACETDFENQGAHHLAKEFDPEGKRTIGVLTKPDRISPGDEDRWLNILRNQTEPLENNWYCVKQPSSISLTTGISWADARKQENEFFSMTSPWSTLDPMYQKYLRTSNLTDRLSTILSDLISRRLPQIQEELQKLLRKTEEGFAELPVPPSDDAFGQVMQLLSGFMRNVSSHIEGVPKEDGLLQTIRPVHETFRKAILATAPMFRPYERKYSSRDPPRRPQFLSTEEYEEEDEMGDEEIEPGAASRQNRSVARVSVYVDEVLDRAQRARTRELPGIYPFVVQQLFISSITKQWAAPAKALCNAVYKIMSDYMRDIVTDLFASFGQGGLQQRVLVVLSDHIRQAYVRTGEKIDWLLRLEERPFSLNTHYLADYKDKFLAYYKGYREKDANGSLMENIQAHPDSNPTVPYGVSKVLAGLVEAGVTGTKPSDLAKLLPVDQMEPALNIMADVRAYYQVAYKRFTDNIPLAIDHELVRGLEQGLAAALYEGLGINGANSSRACKELMQESPHIAGRREELTKKRERLTVASQELLYIGF
jgi:GTP-binding protein EngB required for normal cell division